MSASDTLQYLFEELDTEFVVFRGDDELTTKSIPDAAEFLSGEGEIGISLLLANETAIGFYAPGLSENDATFIMKKQDRVMPIILLDEAVHMDKVPEEFTFDVPATGMDGWIMKETSGTFYTLDEAQALRREAPSAAEPAGEAECDGSPTAADEVADVADTAPPELIVAAGQERFQDARLLGTSTPEGDEFLKRPATFMRGKLYGAHDRRNTLDGKWKAHTGPWGSWAVDLFTQHPEDAEKEGTCFVLGESVDGARMAKAMKKMYAIGLDIDSGARLTDVLAKLEELGLIAFVYTSHSHGKDKLKLKRDEVMRKRKLSAAPSLDQIKDYLREDFKDRFEPTFIDAIKIENKELQEKDGIKIVLKTPPLDKFRVVVPLAEPVSIPSLDPSQTKALEIWENKVTGLAVNMLGVSFDVACTDPSRLFYLPRHPKGSEWDAAYVQGMPLEFDSIEPMSKAFYAKNRGAALNPLAMAGLDEGEGIPEFFTPSGKSLREWHRKAKDRYQMADMLEANVPDRIRRAGGEKAGTVHLECPFEHEHSKEGGTGTWASNALDSSSGFWFIQCHHDACQGRHKTEFLSEMLEQGWFEESVLTDEAWLLPGDDDVFDDGGAEPLATWAAGPLTRADWSSPEAATEAVRKAGLGPTSSDADVKLFILRALNGQIDHSGVNLLWEAVEAAGSRLGKRGWNALLKEARAEKDRVEEARQRPADAPDAGPDVAQADSKAQLAYASDCLRKANASEPTLFRYGTEVAEIDRVRETGQSAIRALDFRTFHARLNSVTDFRQQTGENRSRGVRAPEGVALDLYAERELPLPNLRGIVRAPVFGSDGKLIATPGYDGGSGLFYIPPDGLNVPPLPDSINEDVLREARRLLVEELLGDFMFDGVSRDALVKAALGDAVPPPSLLNLIGFMLEQFVRPLIAGPVMPMLITKPIRGAGASLLMETVQTVVDGRPSSRPLSKSEDERRKTVFTALLAGAATIYWDNVVGSVDSQVLAQLFSEDTFTDRELGRSAERQLPVRASFALSGNRPLFSDELRRRLSLVNLDPQSPEPEKRVGFRHRNLPAWTREHRGELVWALLVLVRNWLDRGRPAPQHAPAIGRYESYVDTIGGIIEAAAPNWTSWQANRSALNEIASNDEEEDIATLIETWHGDKVLRTDATARDVAELADAAELGLPVKRVPNGDGFKYAPRSFAAYLKQHKDRTFALSDGTRVKLTQAAARRAEGHPWSLVSAA
ncbi:hypothetical protein [Albimonas pacifica]|uniref:Uncharacterized protein n=1 Tax=Albimonas pacifica TaxID=1114924 RepID=A0A1I3PNT4_9RHOB|nr:hypothetical protein [Albimonas pacifica]SFJ23123.1 hypothetical protein SAMN05216258_1197 [Albimonas pacifica]